MDFQGNLSIKKKKKQIKAGEREKQSVTYFISFLCVYIFIYLLKKFHFKAGNTYWMFIMCQAFSLF